MKTTVFDRNDAWPRPVPYGGRAVVLGGGEIASAIAVVLAQRGWHVALSHDPRKAVLKRAMAFYDVLFGDSVCLGGVSGTLADTGIAIERVLRQTGVVAVTPLDFMDLLVCGPIDLLVDARFEDDAVKPDLRWLAGQSFGIGPGWYAAINCDHAVSVPTGFSPERVVVAPQGGVWYTPVELGTRVFRHMAIGRVGSVTLTAPCDGVVLGTLRDGIDARAGQTAIVINPHLRRIAKGGVDPCGRIVGLRIVGPEVRAVRPPMLRAI